MQTTTQTEKASAARIAHTPGPWEIESRGEGQRFDVTSAHDSRVMAQWRKDHPNATSFSGVSICHTGVHYNGSGSQFGPHEIIDKVEAEANAHLIAAAPDLLEACNRLLSIIHAQVACVDSRFDNGIAAARAAIAKAEGRQP